MEESYKKLDTNNEFWDTSNEFDSCSDLFQLNFISF